MTIYSILKAAQPEATTHLIEVLGHSFAGYRGEITDWCRKVGCPVEEFDKIVHGYRTAMDRAERRGHPEQF